MISTILKKVTDRVRGNSKEGTTFVSFRTPLIQLCQAIPLETIVEFGPGHSTNLGRDTQLKYSSNIQRRSSFHSKRI